ncbi:MAG: hypothetical protein HXM02_11375 [[Eubacterium] sulci]|nr:hypothetical protein [[Eubacterium] sulci]
MNIEIYKGINQFSTTTRLHEVSQQKGGDVEEKEQRKRETMEALSNERMYILLKHNREMMLELRSLYPDEGKLLESYKDFQEAFDSLINKEIESRSESLEVPSISITDVAEKLSKALKGVSKRINES